MGDRTIFIGDLHGVYDETLELLRLVDPTPADHVIFLGDYVDRGVDSAKCVDLVRAREQVQGCCAGSLGNHEDTHLRYKHCEARGEVIDDAKIPPPHVETRRQLKPEHYEWFKSLPLFVRVSEFNAVAVHAGAWPGRPIEAQDPRHLLHIQCIKPYDEHGVPTRDYKSKWPSRVPDNELGWAFWSTFWQGPETIVFGHSVLDKPLVTEHVVGIDGGAVFGRQLHAYVLPERKIITVDAVEDHGRGKRGRGDENIKTFTVHGDVKTFS